MKLTKEELIRRKMDPRLEGARVQVTYERTGGTVVCSDPRCGTVIGEPKKSENGANMPFLGEKKSVCPQCGQPGTIKGAQMTGHTYGLLTLPNGKRITATARLRKGDHFDRTVAHEIVTGRLLKQASLEVAE